MRACADGAVLNFPKEFVASRAFGLRLALFPLCSRSQKFLAVWRASGGPFSLALPHVLQLLRHVAQFITGILPLVPWFECDSASAPPPSTVRKMLPSAQAHVAVANVQQSEGTLLEFRLCQIRTETMFRSAEMCDVLRDSGDALLGLACAHHLQRWIPQRAETSSHDEAAITCRMQEPEHTCEKGGLSSFIAHTIINAFQRRVRRCDSNGKSAV